MKVSFVDSAHEAFYREMQEQARTTGHAPDSYFRSFLYLCGLCPDTRFHFHRLFNGASGVFSRKGWPKDGRPVRP